MQKVLGVGRLERREHIGIFKIIKKTIRSVLLKDAIFFNANRGKYD